MELFEEPSSCVPNLVASWFFKTIAFGPRIFHAWLLYESEVFYVVFFFSVPPSLKFDMKRWECTVKHLHRDWDSKFRVIDSALILLHFVFEVWLYGFLPLS